MDTLAFFKFWRNLGGGGGAAATPDSPAEESDDDEGSFFELELTVPPTEDNLLKESGVAMMPPSKDLFFKNRVMPLEPTSKAHHSPPLSSSLKSTPKFRVFALRKSKSQKTEPVMEEKRLGDFFSENRGGFPRGRTQRGGENGSAASTRKIPSQSKRFPRDCVQKYLKLIRPPHARESSKPKRQGGEQVEFSETASFQSYSSSPAPSSSSAAFMPRKAAALRSYKQQLGKSRSASASATAAAGVSPTAVSRRDDSLLLQHDGIQSAIQYCKRSLSSSSDSSSHLSRSSSSPCDQKSMEWTRKSSGRRES